MIKPNKKKNFSGIKALRCYAATSDDLEKIEKLPSTACPRRYCWWWQTLSFDWEVPESKGCTYLNKKKHKDWKNADIPCSRCDSSSEIDHYEPREPHLLEDGVDDIWKNELPRRK